MGTKDINEIVQQFDPVADGFAERSWANLEFYMHRRFVITTTWGTPLQPRDSVLELGCGDGYLAQLFAQYGLSYRGIDISPNMIAAAERRLQKARLKGDFVVADFVTTPLSDSFDTVVCFQTFFGFVADPLSVLQRLRPYVRKKVIMDLNPRLHSSLEQAIVLFEQAGFQNVSWRPFFVPQGKKLPTALLKTLTVCENLPLLPRIALRWKFLCLIKGETK